MTGWARGCYHAANLLVAGTGLVYAWTTYACRPDDPFAVVNHPWQPHALHLHVVTAPFLAWMIGAAWQAHALPRLRDGGRRSRRSGLALLGLAVPLVASGVLIQAAVSPGWRQAWIAVHLAVSALWIAGSLAHAWAARGPATPRTG